MSKNITISILVVAVLALGGLLAVRPTTIVEVEKVGALAGPDIASPYISVGGVPLYAARTTLTQNASTTCAIQSPSSTSTLIAAGVKFDVASTTGTLLVEMGQSVNPYSTTTKIGGTNLIGAGVKATLMASSTTGNEQSLVFPPNYYFNIKIGGVSAVQVPEGTCQATWMAF